MSSATRKPKKEAPPTHSCQHPGCDEGAPYRAPKSPQALDNFVWFCLKHVREYNRAWNFFQGMSQNEIEAYQHSSNTWHRPTWSMGVNGGSNERIVYTMNGARDDFGLFASVRRTYGHTTNACLHEAPAIPGPVVRAFATLELAPKATAEDVKSRYKELAKRFHPDINGGNKAAEEKIKHINLAYSLLVSSGYC